LNGIYIHIPFCKQACSYCDFYFLTRRELKPLFLNGLIKEIHQQSGVARGTPVETLYIGGGTPSLLSANDIEQILEALDSSFNMKIREFTFECNPDDVSPEYLEDLKSLGVNRISIGIQSFNERILSFMNRAHTREQAVKALELIRKTGFHSFSADLIFGNPGQTAGMLENDLRLLLGFNPPHISAYSLTIEPRTRLGKMAELGRLEIPCDSMVTHHFESVQHELGNAGYEQYEVSNYAKPGQKALHNSNYWKHQNYLGFGPSAHSFTWNGSGRAKRWSNKNDLKAYLENPPETEYLELHQLAEERIMLGLRTSAGITTSELADRYCYQFTEQQLDWISRQREHQNLEWDQHRLQLTQTGLRIADYLVVELLSRY